jgi:hypothetical protein
MGRLHGRTCILYLTDEDGRVLEVPVGDWTIDYVGYPSVPVMRFQVVGPSDGIFRGAQGEGEG